MLNNEQKSIAVISYYWGVADRDVANSNENPEVAYGAASLTAEKILEELGLSLPNPEDFAKFIKEMEEINKVIWKDMK